MLQVKEDDPGPLVLLPELEEVVGGDVRLGPKRDEARHAKPHLLGEGQHRPAQGAGLAGDGQDPLFGQGGEARRQAHPGVGVDEAQGARAQRRIPSRLALSARAWASLGVKPVVRTMAPRAPRRPAASRASGTRSLGTATTTRSTGPGTLSRPG